MNILFLVKANSVHNFFLTRASENGKEIGRAEVVLFPVWKKDTCANTRRKIWSLCYFFINIFWVGLEKRVV